MKLLVFLAVAFSFLYIILFSILFVKFLCSTVKTIKHEIEIESRRYKDDTSKN